MTSPPSDEGHQEEPEPSQPNPTPGLPAIPSDDELKELFSELFVQLHNRAQLSMVGEQAGHTLQATALVSEAYLRLQKNGSDKWEDRDHFMLLASRAMRCVLVDHYRAKHALKRASNLVDHDLELIAAPFQELALDLHALDLALSKLEESEPQMAQAVQMRFFAGTSMEEVARILDMPLRTLERRMTIVRAWLHSEISK